MLINWLTGAYRVDAYASFSGEKQLLGLMLCDQLWEGWPGRDRERPRNRNHGASGHSQGPTTMLWSRPGSHIERLTWGKTEADSPSYASSQQLALNAHKHEALHLAVSPADTMGDQRIILLDRKSVV